jgi:fatty acid desaturase
MIKAIEGVMLDGLSELKADGRLRGAIILMDIIALVAFAYIGWEIWWLFAIMVLVVIAQMCITGSVKRAMSHGAHPTRRSVR